MATIAGPATPQADYGEPTKGFEQAWGNPEPPFATIKTVNNIPIARKFMITGFGFFLSGGFIALLMRIQLGTPENTFLDAETYNQLFTMHGTTMMFLFVIPFIEAVANYLLPLILGTRDLPFPRLTALSYWTYLFGGILLYSSFLFGLAPAAGWFAYVPLSNRTFSPGLPMDIWDLGLSVAEVAAMGAAAEILIAILRMRAPGMTLNRLPLFAWAMLVTAIMIIFAFTPLIVGTAMLELDRKGITSFFVPEAGGSPLLWQHIFWVFGHPEVYIMFIPAVGIVSQVVQTFSRRPIVSYPLMVLAIIATGFLSFGLWVHHMFTTGLSMAAMGFFTAASFAITIPNGLQMFGWIATLWLGRPVWRTPLLFVFGFFVIFVLGGVTGVMVGSVPFDQQAHDSYFVVAHFHYVLIGGVVFPLFAGLYYWLPKITGKMMNETLGKWNFWLMFVFFNVAFFPMHIMGLMGMPRRIYTYPEESGLGTLNMISTVGAFGFAAGVLLFLVNLLWSRRHGEDAGDNPWRADTLEWSQASPPPNAQFPFIPVVRSRHPLWDQRDLEPHDDDTARLVGPIQSAPERWRGALLVSAVDARPIAIAHMPGPTAWPFIMAVGFLILFSGGIVSNLWLIGAAAVLILAAAIGWFRPRPSEVTAIEEIGVESGPGKLPLAVAGPVANGFWGTCVFILILTTALFTNIISYYYLSEGPDSWPRALDPAASVGRPLVASGCLVVAALATWWFLRAVKRGRLGARRLGLAAAWAGAVAFVALTIWEFASTGIRPVESAYGSMWALMLGFEWVVAALTIVMLTVAQLWAWLRPGDVRGDATSYNAALMSWFTAASWLATAAVLYLTPRLW